MIVGLFLLMLLLPEKRVWHIMMLMMMMVSSRIHDHVVFCACSSRASDICLSHRAETRDGGWFAVHKQHNRWLPVVVYMCKISPASLVEEVLRSAGGWHTRAEKNRAKRSQGGGLLDVGVNRCIATQDFRIVKKKRTRKDTGWIGCLDQPVSLPAQGEDRAAGSWIRARSRVTRPHGWSVDSCEESCVRGEKKVLQKLWARRNCLLWGYGKSKKKRLSFSFPAITNSIEGGGGYECQFCGGGGVAGGSERLGRSWSVLWAVCSSVD